jgi:hypothetical protein
MFKNKILPSSIDSIIHNFDSEWIKVINVDEDHIDLPKQEQKSQAEEKNIVINEPSEDEEEQDINDGDVEYASMKQALQEIKFQFSILQEQFKVLHQKYSKMSISLKDFDIKNRNLQLQIAILEDERLEIENKMKESAPRRASLVASSKSLEPRRKRNLNGTTTKNGLEFSLQLLDFVDDDNDGLGQSGIERKRGLAHLFRNFNLWLLDLIPFSKDVQEVKALFGGGVSSYFEFNRWM